MRVLIALAVVAAFISAAACSSGDDGSGSDNGSGLMRKGKAGDITIEATWLDAASGLALRPELQVFPLDTLVIFSVTLDARSSDLSSFSPASAASLRQNESGIVPRAWMPSKEEARHVEGILLFPRVFESGPVTLVTDLGGDKPVEMTWKEQGP